MFCHKGLQTRGRIRGPICERLERSRAIGSSSPIRAAAARREDGSDADREGVILTLGTFSRCSLYFEADFEADFEVALEGALEGALEEGALEGALEAGWTIVFEAARCAMAADCIGFAGASDLGLGGRVTVSTRTVPVSTSALGCLRGR